MPERTPDLRRKKTGAEMLADVRAGRSQEEMRNGIADLLATRYPDWGRDAIHTLLTQVKPMTKAGMRPIAVEDIYGVLETALQLHAERGEESRLPAYSEIAARLRMTDDDIRRMFSPRNVPPELKNMLIAPMPGGERRRRGRPKGEV